MIRAIRLALSMLLAACMAPDDTGVLAFRADRSCDGMGRVDLFIDDASQGVYLLGDGGEQRFDVSVGLHIARAQGLTGQLWYWDDLEADVRAERPVTYLLCCP